MNPFQVNVCAKDEKHLKTIQCRSKSQHVWRLHGVNIAAKNVRARTFASAWLSWKCWRYWLFPRAHASSAPHCTAQALCKPWYLRSTRMTFAMFAGLSDKARISMTQGLQIVRHRRTAWQTSPGGNVRDNNGHQSQHIGVKDLVWALICQVVILHVCTPPSLAN